MRRVFVGDVQGCRQQLEELLNALEFARESDELYPVGDLVNKGPDSAGVLDLLIELGARPVLGNHDLRWLERGRVETTAHEEWLRAQPIVRVMSDIIVVHAGLHPHWTEADLGDLAEADVEFAVTVRYCDETGRRPSSDWPVPEPPYRPWYHFYRGDKRVVFGHWARQGLYRGDKVLGLDSGCVYGKELSAWIAEEDRIVQIPGWRG